MPLQLWELLCYSLCCSPHDNVMIMHLYLAAAGTCKGKIVKIRKMAAHGGLAFGKDSSQKMHAMKQEAQRKLKLQDKQHKRKKAKLQAL